MADVRAIVLAAGFGTRLRPVTEWIPKPLMPLGDVPLLGHILDSIMSAGVEQVAVNTHHLGERIIEFVRSPKYADVVTTFPEDEILGTGGPLVNAKEFLSQDECFVLHNGDILTNLDVGLLVEAHRAGPQRVTMVLLDGPENKLDVAIQSDGRAIVNDILGKLGRGTPSDQKMTYAGISVFSKDIFDHLPAEPEFCSIITAILKLMEAEPSAVAGFIPDDFFWNDLGTVETFLDANARREKLAFLNPSSGTVGYACERLAEQGSNREFYRIGVKGETRVLMRSFPEDADFDRFIQYGELFGVCDLPTPRLFGTNPHNHTVLMEDLGTTTLHDYVQGGPSSISMKLTYGNVVDALVDFQLRAGQAIEKAGIAVREFDYDYLRWETDYFKTRFLEEHLGLDVDTTSVLDDEFHLLARQALELPQLLLHRDFQSQNVMVVGEAIRLVDFQGCRLGPYTYDLASLLLDPYVRLGHGLRDGLLDLYRRRILGSGAVSIHPADFAEHFRIAALQRLMQALGAYGFLTHEKGKCQYLRYVAPALEDLRIQLKGPHEFPNLKRLINRAIELEQARAEAEDLLDGTS